MAIGVSAAGMALLLALPASCGAQNSPLAQMEARGYEATAKISETIGGVPYMAVLFRSSRDAGGNVNIYATLNGKQVMIYTHPSASEAPSLEEGLTQKRFPDFFKDGSRALVYRMVNKELGQSTLYVLRWQKGRFKRAGAFPEGRVRDLDGNGRFEILTRSAPLGRLMTVSCPRFETTVTAAVKTDVQVWEEGGFVSAAERFPAVFERRIAEDGAALAALEPRKSERAGDYVSLAITLYYDYAAAGKGRQGWELLSRNLDPGSALPGAAACLEKIRSDLRARLSIPDDWP